jgi:murein L,D-transpeptidase YcbB/YkuD
MRYLYLLIIFFFSACTTEDKTNNASSDAGKIVVRTDTIYLTRNAEITPANSYSDLFLDSASVEQFILQKKLSEEDAKSFRSFYNYRNLQFAWFTSLGFTEQAKGYWNMQDKFKGSETDKKLRSRMDSLLNNDSLVISRYDTSILNTELSLTNAYLQFFKINRYKTLFAGVSPEKVIPVKKENAVALADSILKLRTDSSSGNRAATQYLQLKQKLQIYNNIAKEGGWRMLVFTSKQLKKGSSSSTILYIKKRLQQTGEMSGNDTTALFNDSLVTAIKNYQLHNGMKPTGIITDTLIRSINIPVDKRIQQIIINLNRMQWMPAVQETNYLTVNIPEFMLYAYENNSRTLEMPVVVGKEGTNTTMFSGNLDQIVFSPYWNIPVSIVKNEILPQMKSNPNYLKSKRMEIVGKNDSLPTIRQLPGAENALGKVKFLFPNRYDIYFHDTNAKDIFKKDVRAVSHGCIRLADAEKVANYLLRNNSEWTSEKIHTAMNNGKEQFVKLNPSMPVSITYFTTWVDETGALNFRDDVYSNDKKISQMMFGNYAMPSTSAPADTVKKK